MRWYQDHLFPKLLDWATRPLYRDRQRLLQGARGRVLELGIGTGANLALYGDAVSEIHGLEPEAAMLALARRHAREAGIRQPLHLLQGDARRLPYPDGHFDTVVACLVFCTIPDPELAAKACPAASRSIRGDVRSPRRGQPGERGRGRPGQPQGCTPWPLRAAPAAQEQSPFHVMRGTLHAVL